MKTASRKTKMNMALKVAIVMSGLTARDVSARTHIPETRLSGLIHFRAEPTEHEKQKLARVLRVDQDTLFPPEPTEAIAS